MTLFWLGVAAFSSMVVMRMTDPMLIELGREYGMSTGQAAEVISAFVLWYGLLQLVFGPLGDRIGKLRVVVAATLGCAVFSALTAAAGSFTQLVWCRAATGAAAAGIVPLTIAWIGDTVPYERRQETLARFMGAALTGMMAGQWYGGIVLHSIGWRPAFVVLAAVFALAGAMVWQLSRHLPRSDLQRATAQLSLAGQGRNILQLLQRPRVRWVLTVTALEGALAYGAMALIPSQLVQAVGMTPAGAGSAMVLFGVGGLLYSQFARHWLRWFGERGLARAGGLLMAVALFTVSWTADVQMAVGACFVAGMGLYMLHNTLQTQATQMAPEARGTAVSLFAGVLFLAQSGGVKGLGAALDRGWLPAVLTVCGAGLVLLGVAVAWRLAPRA